MFSTPTGKLRWLKGRWLNLCYLSNPAVLARNFQVLKRAMWRRRLFLLCCDARLLTDELAKMGTRKKKARQYKGNGVLAAGMDNLYSELVTFNKY